MHQNTKAWVQGSVSNFSSPLLLLFVGITKSSVFEEKKTTPAFFYYPQQITMSQEVAAFKLVLVGDGGTGKVSIHCDGENEWLCLEIEG